jgi:hypothetical protein
MLVTTERGAVLVGANMSGHTLEKPIYYSKPLILFIFEEKYKQSYCLSVLQ